MSCGYCTGEVSLIDTMIEFSNKARCHTGILVDIEDAELYVTAVPDTYEPGFMEEFVQINYCPMCGERLRKE